MLLKRFLGQYFTIFFQLSFKTEFPSKISIILKSMQYITFRDEFEIKPYAILKFYEIFQFIEAIKFLTYSVCK